MEWVVLCPIYDGSTAIHTYPRSWFMDPGGATPCRRRQPSNMFITAKVFSTGLTGTKVCPTKHSAIHFHNCIMFQDTIRRFIIWNSEVSKPRDSSWFWNLPGASVAVLSVSGISRGKQPALLSKLKWYVILNTGMVWIYLWEKDRLPHLGSSNIDYSSGWCKRTEQNRDKPIYFKECTFNFAR